jgi:hypothetical protein
MTLSCQACEARPATVEEPADAPSEPYWVCQACHGRLTTRALRPLEWFNLAKRHGWTRFLLHDDFYDEDGTATQPEEGVEHPVRFPAPSLIDASTTADSLLDYSITRWRLDGELVEQWTCLPQGEVLVALDRRFHASHNAAVRAVVLEIASIAGDPAATLVRHAWGQYPDDVPYWPLVQASAACLPFEEGLARAQSALAAMPDRLRRECFPALAHFRSPRVLTWIEAHAAEPTVESWGRLAAASAFDWHTAKQWLGAGRPLNLIAIDALLAIAEPRTPFLQRLRPSLGAAPSEMDLRQALEAAAVEDPVPRVRQRIGALLSKASALVQLR